MTVEATDFDVVVIGSGAGGLVAALAASVGGARVLVVEKTAAIGGTTALSEGMIWVPANNRSSRGRADTWSAAVDYLRAAAPTGFDATRARTYCANAAAALEFVETHSPVRYELATGSIDYHANLPGATAGIRAFRPRPFDARSLRADFRRLRTPLVTTMAWGGMMLSSDDYAHVLAMRHSLRSLVHVGGLAARYASDRLAGFPRGTRLTNGNAVVAGLYAALRARGVTFWTDANAVALHRVDDRVSGVEIRRPDRIDVRATRGLVLACGGFPGNHEWMRRHLSHVAAGKPHRSMAPASNTGDGLELALAMGARLETRLEHPVAWTPVSLVPQRDGSSVPFPHYVDRAKPGVIAVTAAGSRFCNEAISYQQFVPAMIAATHPGDEGHVWLLADHRAVRRYGLGAAPPAPGRLEPFVRRGYLVRAASIAELAERLAIDPLSLEHTMRRFNADAAVGVDREFGKGESALNRAYGDANVRPNPCLAPLDTPPYYAVRLTPGDIGTFVGLAVDEHARVLGVAGPVPGLYAAGNDVASPTGGDYPAAGVTVGAAMTFGFLAGRALG
jgi:succinate dehydrogenase/fumarate reductase flavoprotein subunit